MNSKALIILVVVLMAVAMVPETNAFTAGGGGNVPSGKREYMKVRHK